MKNIHILVFHFMLIILGCSTSEQKQMETEVLAFEKARFEATRTSDTVRLRAMLADELIWVHSSGKRQGKEEYLYDLSSGSSRYKNITIEASKVRQFGNIAITNGIARYEGISHRDTFDVRAFHTAVYRFQNGHWQVINWQTTKVQ
jgi:hypothetical protein